MLGCALMWLSSWLSPGQYPIAATWALEELGDEQLRELLRPYADGLLAIRPASPLVNDVRNDGPELLNPNALPPTYQLDLPNPS